MQSTRLHLAVLALLVAMVVLALVEPGAALIVGTVGMVAVIGVGIAAATDQRREEERRERSR